MAKRLRVGILFGGRSAEHEVSLRSARNVFDALDRSKYDPVLIGIDREGVWHLNDQARFLLASESPSAIKDSAVERDIVLLPSGASPTLAAAHRGTTLGALDVVFPVLHGPNGEDGTVQGLLKLANVPFVGPSVLGSAAAMDKDVTKRLLRDAGIPICRFVTARRSHGALDLDGIINALGLPIFVKPANLGSSVGISKAKDRASLAAAAELAFSYDTKAVFEEAIIGHEIEVAVLGNESPRASVPGEIAPGDQHEFYSYEAKYLDNEGQRYVIPADLPAEVSNQIRELAVQAFRCVECEGMARVDFFVTESGRIFLNELNTIPGFTSISMYPMLWQASGLSYPALIDTLIQLALERHDRDYRLSTSRA